MVLVSLNSAETVHPVERTSKLLDRQQRPQSGLRTVPTTGMTYPPCVLMLHRIRHIISMQATQAVLSASQSDSYQASLYTELAIAF